MTTKCSRRLIPSKNMTMRLLPFRDTSKKPKRKKTPLGLSNTLILSLLMMTYNK